MYDLVIFDCDGVLVDSEMLSARVLTGALEEFGVTIDLDHFERFCLGRSFPTVAAAIRAEFAVTLPDSFEADYRARLLEVFAAELRVTEGLAAMLDRLETPAAVATSSSPARSERSLRVTGLWDRFGHRLYTASQVARGKPAPDLFLHTARAEGADPARCLVIEDSAPGLAAASAAGMASLHFAGGSHLKGRPARLTGSLGRIESWESFPALCPELFAPAPVAAEPTP